jgi:formate hydrogenlyase transcriptional activator
VPQFEIFIAEDITERKRLEDQLRRERDRLRLLLDLSNTFVSKLGLHDFFDALAEGLRQVEGWEYSFVALSESVDHLKVQLVGGGAGELRVGTSLPIEGTIAGHVYRSGQFEFFRVADLLPVPNNPELTSWREFARAAGLQVGCNLPLRYDRKVLGILGFHTRKDMESAKDDLGFLQELAKLVALALHNALRYGELSESHEKLVYQKNYIEDQIRSEFGVESIIGQSDGLRDVLKQVNAVAPTDTTVLVLGDTGTGKELIARAIHDHSLRHDQSFIKVDSVAIPATLMESELFGHEKGAFTGAIAAKVGRFEAADQGTLFLDEVGDVPLELQSKLLRVLQDHAFERLGSNRTRHVNVRIVAATNRDLEAMVEAGKFRDDLYYRLKVFPIMIPPLRERQTDIPLLVQHYVAKYARRMKKNVSIVPAAAMEVFMRYPWPGNVRELQHFIERSVVISTGKVLQAPVAELERLIEKRQTARRRSTPGRTLHDIERESILQALKESDWVVGGPNGAAARLGLKRTTLASRMEKLGIWRRRRE